MLSMAARRRSTERRSQGFTLVETLMAIVILGIGVMSLASLIPAATQNDYRSRIDTTATFLAARELEQILQQQFTAISFTDAPDGAGNAVNVNLGAGGATLTANGEIDYSQPIGAVPAGYRRDYVIAAGAAGTPKVNATVYDIRWSIGVNGANVKRIVISARQRNPSPGMVGIPASIRAVKMR
jgi:prepilin-type N-terminal cleavage/methylation domain-containing protein